MDIKKSRPGGSFTAPTPNNTPSIQAPISSSTRPLLKMEGIPEKPSGSSSRPGDLFANNAALVNMLQGKLGSLVGKPSGYVPALPKSVQKRVFALSGLQAKHTELERQFHLETLELEKKYLKLYETGYTRRQELINGAADPTPEEIEAGKEREESDAPHAPEATNSSSLEEIVDEANEAKGIPEFWLTALKNHVQFGELITERDEPAMKALTDIRMAYLDDQPGYRVEFEFTQNEWFENRFLTKTYYYEQAPNVGDLIYKTAEGCEIQWKEGKNLCMQLITKKQKHKATKKTRVITSFVPTESFFNFFKTPKLEEIESDSDEEEGLGREEKLTEMLEEDYALGEELKGKIIPHGVDWFTGKALEYEELSDGDEFFGDEDDDDEEEDDDDGDDDEADAGY